MNQKRILRKILAAAFLMIGITVSGCGSGTPAESTVASVPETQATVATSATTVATPPSVPVISGTIAPNAQAVTWTETAISPEKTMYVSVKNDFLKVRTGPGTEYAQVSSLTDGMAVIVVAKTDSNWYKLKDGFYVSGDYVKDTP